MIFIKLMIFILIFLSSTYIGFSLSKKYICRVNDLKAIKSSFNIISTKIRYTYDPIIDICKDIQNTYKGQVSKIYEGFINSLNTLDITKAWENAIERFGTSFNREDKDILKSFGKLLGKTDVEGQLNEIYAETEYISLQIDKAEVERSKNEKMYKSLGIIIGIAIVIILF